MSNILIIKHGSLGDISQACGAIQDISEAHKGNPIYLLTTKPYFDLWLTKYKSWLSSLNKFNECSTPW